MTWVSGGGSLAKDLEYYKAVDRQGKAEESKVREMGGREGEGK